MQKLCKKTLRKTISEEKKLSCVLVLRLGLIMLLMEYYQGLDDGMRTGPGSCSPAHR